MSHESRVCRSAAQGVLRLGESFGLKRLEAACAQALNFGTLSYRGVKPILSNGFDQQSELAELTALEAPTSAPGASIATAAICSIRAMPTHQRSTPSRPTPSQELHHEPDALLEPMLKQLRLSGILDSLEARNRQAVEAKLAFTDFLAALVQDEVARRDQRQFAQRLRRAQVSTTRPSSASTSPTTPRSTRRRSPIWQPAASSPSTPRSCSSVRPAPARAT